MHLLIGQIVYTSLVGVGFKSLASSQVSREVQQAFIQRVAAKYWDASNPPKSGYRAVYLHQLTAEHTLFGWLYNDGVDDVGCNHVPYFLCYYLAEPLLDFHLENIFDCLQKGPLGLIERQNLPSSLETIVIQTPWTFNKDFWSYQPVRPGVEIPLVVRVHSHIDLKQRELLNMFLPITEQETVIQTDKQQIAQSVFPEPFVEGIDQSAVALSKNAATLTVGETFYRRRNENLQRYEQALVKAFKANYVIDDQTRNSLKRLQQFLGLKNEDIEQIEAQITRQIKAIEHPAKCTRPIKNKDVTPVKATTSVMAGETNHRSPAGRLLLYILSSLQRFNIALEQSSHRSFVLAYRNSQFLLGLGIAASSLALIGSIYGLLRTSMFQPSKPELIPSGSGVSYQISTKASDVSQALFNYGEVTSFVAPSSKAIVSPIDPTYPINLSYLELNANIGFSTVLKMPLPTEVSFRSRLRVRHNESALEPIKPKWMSYVLN